MDQNFNVQTSILLAALIISGSIIYSSGSFRSSASNVAAVAAGIGAAPTENLKVTDRASAAREGNGKLVVVEFSDFQCPYCQNFYNTTYKELKQKYIDTGKVTFVYRQLPLSFHPYAQKAAEASECANAQGKFWPYYDKLFSTGKQDGSNLSVSNLKQYAADLGLDATSFNSCLDTGEKADIVKTDSVEAARLGISGTPSFVINGQKIVGAQPVAVFEQVIDAALK